MKQILNDVMILKLTLWVATFGIGSNGAESEYEIAHILGHGVGGGGDSAYERGGDVRRKFWIKPLKETDLGVAKAFFDP